MNKLHFRQSLKCKAKLTYLFESLKPGSVSTEPERIVLTNDRPRTPQNFVVITELNLMINQIPFTRKNHKIIKRIIVPIGIDQK